MLQMNTHSTAATATANTNKHDMQNLINILREFCLFRRCCAVAKETSKSWNGDNRGSKGNSVDGL